jgi:hypothetical protein
LQYLHRVRIVDNQAQKISPNLDIIQEDSNLKAEDEESKTTVLEKVSVINSQEASYNKKMQNTKSMSANLNKYLLVACSVVIIIASPFCIVEYRNNLECIEKERIYEANWEEQFQIYKIEYEQWLAEGESRITKEYKECKLRQKPSDESNKAFAKYLNNFDFCGSSRTTAERDLYNARNATLEDIKNEYSKINNRYSGMFCQ